MLTEKEFRSTPVHVSFDVIGFVSYRLIVISDSLAVLFKVGVSISATVVGFGKIRFPAYGDVKVFYSVGISSEFRLGEASVVESDNTIRIRPDCAGIGINGFHVALHLVERIALSEVDIHGCWFVVVCH